MGTICCKPEDVQENQVQVKTDGNKQNKMEEVVPPPKTSTTESASGAPKRPKGAHEVVVCLMMENRSLDNILGYMYTAEELGLEGDKSKVIESAKHFNGVVGKDLWNPVPEEAKEEGKPDIVKVHPYPDTPESYDFPDPNPGEEYPHVNVQLYDTTLPASNQGKTLDEIEAPYNLPPNPPKVPPMSGFVRDYVQHFELSIDNEANPGYPSYDKFKKIMGSLTPKHVPVITKLAREFCVCDRWFCSVPSQTFTNRSFFISGQSAGNVVNGNIDGEDWVTSNTSKTMFDQLEEAGVSWAVYYDLEDIFSVTLLINYPTLKKYLFTNNFRDYDQFKRDAAEGNLPQYCFVEPRLLIAQNSYHPPWHGFPSDVRAGDALVKDVYDTVFSGPQKDQILLAITFDEHGGTYDHVPPPSGVPPPNGDNQKPGQYGFMFDRLGVRVPTILVSPYIKRHSVCSQELWHTSWMKTVRDVLFKEQCSKLKQRHLTERDRAAPTIPLNDFIDFSTKRELPQLELNPTYNECDVQKAGLVNVHDFAKGLLRSWLVLIKDHSGSPDDHSNNERNTMVKNIEFFLNRSDTTMSEFKEHLRVLSDWSIRHEKSVQSA